MRMGCQWLYHMEDCLKMEDVKSFRENDGNLSMSESESGSESESKSESESELDLGVK
jgi:hypothetical protein